MTQTNLRKKTFDNISDESIQIYLETTKEYPALNRKQTNELVIKAQNGDYDARNKLIISNLHTIVRIAKNYQNRGLDFDDMFQEGVFGLIFAINNYDCNSKISLSTYAIRWVTNAISRAIIFKSKNIHLPIELQFKLQKIEKVINDCNEHNNQEHTTEELAKKLGMSTSKLEQFLTTPSTISYNDIINTDSEDRFIDTFSLDDQDLSEKLFNQATTPEIIKLLEEAGLSEREINVIKLRYGIGQPDQSMKSIKEVGNIIGITHTGVKKIIERVLGKLVSHPKTRELAIYMDRPDIARATSIQLSKTPYRNQDYSHIIAEEVYDEFKRNGIPKEIAVAENEQNDPKITGIKPDKLPGKRKHIYEILNISKEHYERLLAPLLSPEERWLINYRSTEKGPLSPKMHNRFHKEIIDRLKPEVIRLNIPNAVTETETLKEKKKLRSKKLQETLELQEQVTRLRHQEQELDRKINEKNNNKSQTERKVRAKK